MMRILGRTVRCAFGSRGGTTMAGTVLVYGATGTQGTPVEDQLLKQGKNTRMVTRDADHAAHWAARGAEVAVADLGDRESLAAANDGIDRVVLQLPLQYDFELHEAYGRNAVDAAKAAGVKLVVFNTSAHVIAGENVHAYEARQEVVDYLRASGIPSVVIRPTFYYEIFLGPWIRPGIVDSGVVAFPLPAQFPMSWISAEETAAYAVAALERGDLAGQEFDVGGPEALTGDDIAARFGEVMGRSTDLRAHRPRRLRACAGAHLWRNGRVRGRGASEVHDPPRYGGSRHDGDPRAVRRRAPIACALDQRTRGIRVVPVPSPPHRSLRRRSSARRRRCRGGRWDCVAGGRRAVHTRCGGGGRSANGSRRRCGEGDRIRWRRSLDSATRAPQ